MNVEFLFERLFSFKKLWSSSIESFIFESEISFFFTFAYVLKLDAFFWWLIFYFYMFI